MVKVYEISPLDFSGFRGYLIKNLEYKIIGGEIFSTRLIGI